MPDGPITDVNSLTLVSGAVAAQIKAAAVVDVTATPRFRTDAVPPTAITKPGVERWPVKTGRDADRNAVGNNVIAGRDLDAGIVAATVDELITAARPAGMVEPRQQCLACQVERVTPVETTIWQVYVTIIAVKLEADGDYHLGAAKRDGRNDDRRDPDADGLHVGDPSWLANMRVARWAIDTNSFRCNARETVAYGRPGSGLKVHKAALTRCNRTASDYTGLRCTNSTSIISLKCRAFLSLVHR